MDNAQKRNSSAADTRVVSVGTYFHLGRGYGSRPQPGVSVSKTRLRLCCGGSIVTS